MTKHTHKIVRYYKKIGIQPEYQLQKVNSVAGTIEFGEV